MRLSKRAGQNQLIHGSGDNQTPAFKLFRATDPRFGPKQVLLEKPRGVLMREARAIRRDNLAERQESWSYPAKPTPDKIALGPFGPFSYDAVDTHLHLSCLANMQMVPTLLTGLRSRPRSSVGSRFFHLPALRRRWAPCVETLATTTAPAATLQNFRCSGRPPTRRAHRHSEKNTARSDDAFA